MCDVVVCWMSVCRMSICPEICVLKALIIKDAVVWNFCTGCLLK